MRDPIPDPPFARWFPRWRTNLAFNCLDRWKGTERDGRTALLWEGEPGEVRAFTYRELREEVERTSEALRQLGVGPGDRITIYLPMIPEAAVAMLATVRLGAIHSVVFGGFASHALAERMNDSGSRVLITADGGYRRGRVVPLKEIADAALLTSPSVERVLVVRRTGARVPMTPGRDIDYESARSSAPPAGPAELVDGIHPSFVLYTSGTTGRPKGAVHSTAGYMAWLHHSMQAVFGPRPEDRFWCTADVGWVTGHSYVVYGPLLHGLTTFLYEGAPDHPAPDRWWSMVERHRLNILYTSPTAIRGFIRMGEAGPAAHDLSSLRLLGSVGEAINPEAWRWYHRVIGHGRLDIVDTYWQTETGGTLISPQPGFGFAPQLPGSATLPLPGVDAALVDEHGRELGPGERGLLVLRQPWPGEFLGLWNDDGRFRATYFARFPAWYYPADFARIDEDGYFTLLGRADEVMKVAGHRLSTKEIEDALITHPAVAESAVTGRRDEVKGEVPVAFVILRPGHADSRELRTAIVGRVREELGAIAVPSELYVVEKVPKTRSAKIMRRLIRDVVEDRPLGDTTTLEDETSVEEARRAYRELREQMHRTSE